MSLKLAKVTTICASLRVLARGFLRYLHEQGCVVHTVSAPDPEADVLYEREHVARVHSVPMSRSISPLADLRALWRLYRIFRREKFPLVHASTPKGGLLGMLAAWLARVPVRIFTYRGWPTSQKRGLKRSLLLLTDRISFACSTHATAIAHSLADELVAAGMVKRQKLRVIHHGSSNGIDARRFVRNGPAAQAPKRREWEIPADGIVIGFVGRLVRDKGVVELAEAWQRIREKHPRAYLLLVGTPEPQDPPPPEIIATWEADERVRMPGWMNDVCPAYEAMDLLVLPTYREGFGNVLLEANCYELPVIASDISGCQDAVAPGVSGLLVTPRDPVALAEALDQLLGEAALRTRLGKQGRARVEADFQPADIWRGYWDLYCAALVERGCGEYLSKPPIESRE